MPIKIIVPVTTAASPLIRYLVKQTKLPELEFDGVWKEDSDTGMRYFLKVKQVKGQGTPKEIQIHSLVGIKGKLEPKTSSWFLNGVDVNLR
jgi:hypothetical protein